MGKLIIIFFFLLSCTKYSDLERNEYGNYFFKSDKIHLKDVDLVPWKVGITTKKVLTKGIIISLGFPVLRNKDIFSLFEKSSADSWILKVKRSSALGSTVLGYFYSPFLLPGIPGIAKLRAKPIKSITFQIYYTAATLPDELVNSPCPPMNHRKVISEILVDPISNQTPTMTFNPDASYTLEEGISEYSYQTPTLNGGPDLAGVYHMEISFFDSKRKMVMGDWVEYPETVTVIKESDLPLEECYNFTPPKLSPDYHNFKRFKWKENMFKEEGY